jgi:hypothetical protein
VQSSLVLVDVISQDPKSGLPIQDFQTNDFRVLANRREVPIVTFRATHRRPTTDKRVAADSYEGAL